MSVERCDQDKDADENVDAHHVRKGDLFEVDNPSVCVWIATCSCEISRNFPCSRNAYKPFSDESGNVELFELCETIPKVQC